VDVALDCVRELCEIAVADDAPELTLGLEHPGAVGRRHMSPFCQCLTLREVVRTIWIIDSIGFVELRVRQSWPSIPSR